MNTNTQSRDDMLEENLLVIDDNGRIMSRRVSQFYGTALLGAISLQMNSHDSSLSQTESWTLNRIKRAAQAVAPGDNIMFIDDSRRIRSCRINPDYGTALLENLPQNPKEVADCAKAAWSYDIAIQSSEASGSKQETRAESSQRPTKQSEPTARILSDHILSTVNRQPYDRDWMSKHNIDESCLNGPSSKIKLDVLVKNGAIKTGDLLCVIYELDDGSASLEVGKVSRCCCLPASHLCSKEMLIYIDSPPPLPRSYKYLEILKILKILSTLD